MDFVKALTFMTEDPKWKEKLAIGTGMALLAPLIIPAVILMGYCVRLLQNMREGQQFPLPEWDDWSGDLVRGFKLFVVTIVWLLPVFLVMLPAVVGGVMTDSDSGFLETLGIIILVGTMCLTFIYAIFVTLMTPGFTIWFARDEEIRSGLQMTEIFEWTRHHVSEVLLFTIAYIVASFVISMVAGTVGMLLCFVGLIVTVPLGTLAVYLYQYNLLGQIAYQDRTGERYYKPAVPLPSPYIPQEDAPSAPPVPPAPAATDAPAEGDTEPPQA